MKVTNKNNKLKYLALMSFILISNYINAQITVTGKVTDTENQAIEFANVILLNTENKEIVAGTITDANGNFTVKTNKKGKFSLQISFIGFENYAKDISSTINLGNIALKYDTELDEVVITARKKIIERKVDRLVFNVQNSPFLKGGDGIEALKKAPRVRVQDGAVSIIGKESVIVMVNDREVKLSGESLASFLGSIQSDNIKSIEIITNPPAKYEASGNTGIINIILMEKRNDFYSGSVWSGYHIATYNLGYLGGSLNFKKDKFSLSTSVHTSKGALEVLYNSNIYYPDERWADNNVEKAGQDYSFANMSLDYDISENSSFGVQYYGVYSKPYRNSDAKTKIYDNRSNTVSSVINTKSNTTENSYRHNINAHFEAKLDTLGKAFSANVDYFTYDNEKAILFESSSEKLMLDQSKNNKGTQDIKTYSGKVDLELPYKFAKITAGARVSFLKSDNKIKNFDIIDGVPILNSNQSNVFEYTENNQALYISASKEINTKWSTKIGLRLEGTQTKGYSATLDKTTPNDYLKLFPTFYLNYKLNNTNFFTLDYGRRIARPSFFYLNPFRIDTSIYSYVEGNPFLKPSFTDNIEFSHTYKDKLISAIYYKHIQSGFSQITILHPGKIEQVTPKNYLNLDEIGIIESFSFNVLKNWESSNQLYIYYTKSASTIYEVKPIDSDISAYISTNNSFILNSNKTLFTSVNYWYAFPSVDNLYIYDAHSQLDIGFKALFLDKKMTLSVNVQDVLRSNEPTYTMHNGDNIKFDRRGYSDNRRLIFGLTYRFGSDKIGSKSRKSSNDSERNRT